MTKISLAVAAAGRRRPFRSLDRLDLKEIELHRGFPAENTDENFELALLGVDFVDDAGEIAERTVLDPNVLAEREGDLRE